MIAVVGGVIVMLIVFVVTAGLHELREKRRYGTADVSAAHPATFDLRDA